MQNKKNYTWVYILTIFIVVLVGLIFVFNSNKKQTILIASGHPEWPPIMWQDGEKIIGAGPELVQKICDDLKINCEIKYEGQWQDVQDKTKDGTVDMLVAAYKTTEREQYMDYSDAYTTDPITLFIKSGSDFVYKDWNSLIDKQGVVMTGDSYGQEFDNFIKDKLTVEKVATAKEAFDRITSGDAQYFVYALYSGRKAMNELDLNNSIESIPDYIASENFYITISKKSPFAKYMSQINELIKKYQANDMIKNLIEQNEAKSNTGNQ